MATNWVADEEYKKLRACGYEDVEWLREWFEYGEICTMGDCGAKLQTNETDFFENAKFWFRNCVTRNEFKVR